MAPKSCEGEESCETSWEVRASEPWLGEGFDEREECVGGHVGANVCRDIVTAQIVQSFTRNDESLRMRRTQEALAFKYWQWGVLATSAPIGMFVFCQLLS